jgi:hypothetical protein
MRVRKYGQVVDIPVKAGTVVRLRESRSGKVTDQKAIVVGLAPSSDFSRAYGRQAYVCTIFREGAFVSTTGAGDLYPVGKAKRVPAVCKRALERFEKNYPTLARKRRR